VLVLEVNMILIFNARDTVNSIRRLFGNQIKGSEARNNLFLGLPAFGDGWHANHHKFPWRARHGSGEQFNLTII
jgi:fatty-acid desaturase|tara:strand:+ start:703 stop:924 length:222 start_codon:yes stop_codon:yes gene_type:complete